MNFFMNIFFIMFFISCAQVGPTNPRVKVDESTRALNAIGIENFFLPAAPQWINFSTTGKCMKSSRLEYLNLRELMQSFQFKYNDLVNIQYSYNKKIEEKSSSVDLQSLSNYLTPEEKMYVFNDVIEKTQAGVNYFQMPDYHQIHLIWIDLFPSDIELKKWLASYERSDLMNEGYPVIISLCMDHKMISEKLKNVQFENSFQLSIGAELFSVYDGLLNQKPYFSLDLEKFFANKNLVLIVPKTFFEKKNENLIEFQGQYKLIQY